MNSIWFYLITGSLLGLTSGISPGPLLALLISETLRRNAGAGIRVALAPLATDSPIILLALLVLTRMSAVRPLLGIIALAGAVFLLLLGYENLFPHPKTPDIKTPDKKASGWGVSAIQSPWRKGVAVNFLNPHVYLFWFTVGVPALLSAKQNSPAAPALLLLGFFTLLIGSKIVIALLIGKSRALLQGKTYIFILKFLGLFLWLLAALFIKQGLQDLGILRLQ